MKIEISNKEYLENSMIIQSSNSENKVDLIQTSKSVLDKCNYRKQKSPKAET